MWALHNLNPDTHRSQLRVSCPCSLVWPNPLYAPSPAHGDFARGQRSPLPLSGLSPRLWPAQPWLAVAFPFWEFHPGGRHYPSAAMEQSLDLNCCKDRDDGTCECVWTMASYLFVSLSKLFQVVLQKADLLSLAAAVVCVLRVHVRVLQRPHGLTCTLSSPPHSFIILSLMKSVGLRLILQYFYFLQS